MFTRTHSLEQLYPSMTMANRPSSRLKKWMLPLSRLIAFSPSTRYHESRVGRGSLDSPRQREVQLELDLFDHRKQPWFFTD